MVFGSEMCFCRTIKTDLNVGIILFPMESEFRRRIRRKFGRKVWGDF